MRNIVRIILWNYIMRSIIRYVIGITYYDNSVLKNTKQFILVANHNSHLDTATILSSLPADVLANTYPVAAADYFGKTPLMTSVSEYFLNALLIKRNRGDKGKNPIEQMDDFLKSGKSLILFPEGSRGSPEQMQEFKKGVGILLEKNPQIPFIPVFLDGMGRALPKGDGLLVPFTGSIKYGDAKFKTSEMCIDSTVKFVHSSVLELSPIYMRGL